MKEITKENLLKYGMVENTGGDSTIFPLIKTIGKDDEVGELSIAITRMRNSPELCLLLPDGATLYLNIKTIDELEAFEKCIAEYEPNY